MFLTFRGEVEDALRAALDALGYPTGDLGIEEPPEEVDAVLASSVAFRLAGEAGAPPPDVAEEIAGAIDPGAHEHVGDVNARGPYVNFFPSGAYYAGTLNAGASPEYGRLDPKAESVVVEHTSANPTGPIHVGRARNPILGDAIARILDFAGYDVERHYYVNDAGRQIATFTWAYETFDEEVLPEPERDRIEYDLVRYYRAGTTFLEEGDLGEFGDHGAKVPDVTVEDAEGEIESIMQGLEAGDPETYERVSAVVDRVLSGMRECLGRLPAEFDEFVKETRFMREPPEGIAPPDGEGTWIEDLVARLRDLDAAVYEEGAWQLDLSDRGIEKNLVFLRSDGTSLYATRDLAHHEWKFENFDRAVTVLGEDHRLQADQVRATLDLLDSDTDTLEQVFYSWVNLPEGGMSTREGTGVDLDDLLDEAVSRARGEVETRLDDRLRDDDLTEDDVERIARQVGIGAVRYDVVATQPTKGITFSWEEALDFEAQSAPYVQYVHARCCGILDGTDVPGTGDVPEDVDASALDTAAERELLETIARFPAVVEAAAEELQPHRVATYTRDLAEAFNAFYRECPVLDAEGETRAARLALVAASRHAMANALDLLGVEAPTSM
ncbi:MAG: arginine--tRNA ligase [Halobacteriales archaeon]